MFKYDAGAMHRANNDARNFDMGAVNDLVRRTLEQHGLGSGAGAGAGASTAHTPDFVSSLLEQVLPQGKMPMDIKGNRGPQIPEGAEFRSGTYACDAGTRTYRLYVPSSGSIDLTGMVVMLHGCTQTAEDFAAGTGMNLLAEKHRFAVLYPQQARGNNAQSCWNWFSPGDQKRGRGEPAILAGMTAEFCRDFGIPKSGTFVAGLSAGGAMAAVLGETYPDVFAAVGVHSGLPYGAARDVPSAFSAMAGKATFSDRQGSPATAIPTIVFHGKADTTVNPVNADQIAEHVRRGQSGQTIGTSERKRTGDRDYSRSVETMTDGTMVLETWQIDGLGHAWSGGSPAGSYTDASGPNASAEMVRFFYECENGSV